MNARVLAFRRRWIVGGVVIVSLGVTAIAGVARAVIPDGGLLHVCFNNSTGALRASDSSSTCRASEASLDVYTRSGADTAFLARTGTAANADALGGTPASAYVKSGSTAGGDLTGTFPNPTLHHPLDADTLDGRPYWAYVHGDGTVVRGETRELDFGETAHFDVGQAAIDYHCSAHAGGDDTVTVKNGVAFGKLPGFVEDSTGISYHEFENAHPEDFTVPVNGGRVMIETMPDPSLDLGTERVEIHGAHDFGLFFCVVAFDAIATKTIAH
jgi:hypothetical protein